MRHEIDILDTEYTTPAQAAEIRRMKAELPLWQEMELAKQATINVEPHAIDCFSTEAPKVDADTVKATGDVLSGDYGNDLLIEAERRFNRAKIEIALQSDRLERGEIEGLTVTFDGSLSYEVQERRPSWADYVAQIELHRAINKTQGMESEE